MKTMRIAMIGESRYLMDDECVCEERPYHPAIVVTDREKPFPVEAITIGFQQV